MRLRPILMTSLAFTMGVGRWLLSYGGGARKWRQADWRGGVLLERSRSRSSDCADACFYVVVAALVGGQGK